MCDDLYKESWDKCEINLSIWNRKWSLNIIDLERSEFNDILTKAQFSILLAECTRFTCLDAHTGVGTEILIHTFSWSDQYFSLSQIVFSWYQRISVCNIIISWTVPYLFCNFLPSKFAISSARITHTFYNFDILTLWNYFRRKLSQWLQLFWITVPFHLSTWAKHLMDKCQFKCLRWLFR